MAAVEQRGHPFPQLSYDRRDIEGEHLSVAHQYAMRTSVSRMPVRCRISTGVPFEAAVGLVAVLGGVDVDGQAVDAGEFGGGGEVGVADGVGRVRGERGGDAAAGATPVP